MEARRGGALAGSATSPVWGVPPTSAGSTSLVPCSQAATQQAPSSNLVEEVANKAAEITVLRSRLKEFDRENLKMKHEVAMVKDKGAQSDQVRKMHAEMERMQNELRYAKADLMSSEDERKRLKTSWEGAHAELKAVKIEKAQTLVPPPMGQSMPPAPSAVSASSPSAMHSGANARVQSPIGFSSHAAPGGLPYAPTATQPWSASGTQPSTSSPVTQSRVATAGAQSSPQGPVPSPSRSQSLQWRQDVLLRELACWEAASKAVSGSQMFQDPAEPVASWFALRETVGRLSHNRLASRQQPSKSNHMVGNHDLAAAVAVQLQAAQSAKRWVVVQGGARFVQVLLGLFPDAISVHKTQTGGGDMQQKEESVGAALFNELAEVLHAVVLDSDEADAQDAQANDARDRIACAAQVLKALVEIVGKLRHHELDALGSAFRRPSLCALLVESPSAGSLHLLCLQLLQALLAGKELYALAHGADCHENLLLAVANLLIVPSIEACPHDRDALLGRDTAELQQCRVSALQIFCRCLASAPRLDMVLQLRGAPTVDGETVETVLQRVVFLCHHELLCLGIHGVDGGSWHDHSLHECAKRRQRAVELSLMILSSFVWHAVPEMNTPNHVVACSEACAALGRMRPLVASIVDMVSRRAARSPYYTRLLSSTSALRVLLAHAGGEESCTASGDCSACSGNGRVADVNLMVID